MGYDGDRLPDVFKFYVPRSAIWCEEKVDSVGCLRSAGTYGELDVTYDIRSVLGQKCMVGAA